MLLFCATGIARSEEAIVAVAANFTAAAEQLVETFESGSEHRIKLSIGSTGKLYAQIVNGAPFDLFLSADSKHPALLDEQARTIAGSRFTYAIGRLVVLSRPGRAIGEDSRSVLAGPAIRRVALANPDLAPYGQAALESISAAGLDDEVLPKLIIAETVGQVFAFVQSSNVDLGFLALSQVVNSDPGEIGETWLVPPEFYSPIHQDAVLTNRAADNPAAIAFFEFLQGTEARKIIEGFGYGFPPADA